MNLEGLIQIAPKKLFFFTFFLEKEVPQGSGVAYTAPRP